MPIAAQQAAEHLAYSFDFVYYDFRLEANGKLNAYLQINIESKQQVNKIRLNIPYKAGQSIDFLSFYRSDINANGQIVNPIGVRSNTPLTEKSEIGEYYVHDTGKSIEIEANASIPKNQRRRLELKYVIYQGANRYPDVATLETTLLREGLALDIGKLALAYRIDAVVFPGEKKEFFLQEHNKNAAREAFLKNYDKKRFAALLADGQMNIGETMDAEFFYYGENIPANVGLSVKAVMPQIWLSKLHTTGQDRMLTKILREHRHYEINKVLRNDLRQVFTIISLVLLTVASIYYALLYFSSLYRRYRVSKLILNPKQEQHPYSIFTFLSNRRLDARCLTSIIFELVEASYISLYENEIRRVPERLTRNNKPLHAYQELVLHWIWDLMDGEDSVEIDKVETRILHLQEQEVSALRRVENIMELYCYQEEWLALPGKRSPKKFPLFLGVICFSLAIAFSAISYYLLPLVLLIPAAVSIYYAFQSVRYTKLGERQLLKAKSYKHFLEDIDQSQLSKKELLENLEDFGIGACALNCSKEFYFNLRYILQIDEILESGILRKYGYIRLQTVTENFKKQKNDIKADSVSSFYKYLHKEQEQKIEKIHNVLIRLRYRDLKDQQAKIRELN